MDVTDAAIVQNYNYYYYRYYYCDYYEYYKHYNCHSSSLLTFLPSYIFKLKL